MKAIVFLSHYPRAAATVLASALIIELAAMIWVDNIYFKSGKTLQSLEDVTERQRVENQMLIDKIASESSLRVIEQKAQKMGFKHIERMQVINGR